MNHPKLSRRQSKLMKELDMLRELLFLDHHKLASEDGGQSLTIGLELARSKLIRGQIVAWYTLLDELFNIILSEYFFGSQRTSIQLWKTRKYQNFNYCVLEELHLMQKLKFIKAIKKLPKTIANRIEYFNSLRNGVVHAFFPENLRRVNLQYRGNSVFSYEGVKLLQEDIQEVFDYFDKWPAIRRALR